MIAASVRHTPTLVFDHITTNESSLISVSHRHHEEHFPCVLPSKEYDLSRPAWHGAADLAESKRVRQEADTLMVDAADRLRAAEQLQRQAHEVIERAKNGKDR